MNNPKFAIGLAYYIILIVAIITAMACYYLCIRQGMRLNPDSPTALILQYVMITYVLLTLPLGFKFMSDTDGKKFYRLIMYGVGLVACIVCYYITSIMSMFWLAAIEAIAIVISKPRRNTTYENENENENS